MKKLFLLPITIIALFIISSCSKAIIGSGQIVTENRTSSEFHDITNECNADIHILHGPEYKVEIHAQKNIIDYLETNVQGQELSITYRNNTLVKPTKKVDVYITCPYYSSLTIAGSGNMDAYDNNTSSTVSLLIEGSGNINCKNLNATTINSEIAGSGSIEISGTNSTSTHKIGGSGNIKAYNLNSQTTNASIDGSGSIYVNISNQLDASIDGSGSIYYKGNPSINTSINGSGRVKKVN